MLSGAVGPLVRINVPRFIAGRFSGDLHWPALRDHQGKTARLTLSQQVRTASPSLATPL